jgi:adenine C2-methylase RlmN of 23S rRNA A2503 and tRNA A37
LQSTEFRRILREEFCMACTIRQEKGSDISGACGQLAVEHKNGTSKGLQDIEEVASRLLAL